jgi:hypothetical protein
MKERTSLAEECGWSASLPVWASSKEAVSVEAVSTAIQSSNQRDRVRVTTARDVGADPSNRRIATCAPLKDYSSEHESDVNVRRGGRSMVLRKIHNSIAHKAHYGLCRPRACHASCRPRRSAAIGACVSSSDRLETLSAETERTFASNDAIEPRVFDGDAAAVP